MKCSHQAIIQNDFSKEFACDSYKRHPHEVFVAEGCPRCPHERLKAPLRWEEPIVEIKAHENFEYREVRVRRLKT